MKRKKQIEKLIEKFEGLKLVAFGNQLAFMTSIETQFKNKGDLNDKQILTAEKIIEQCSDFSSAWRNTRSMAGW